ncbi:MAG: hypothetical protein ACRD27_11215 [Terracidiphilus sp.]
MTRIAFILSTAACAVLVCASLSAQLPTGAEPGPIPPALHTANKIFVSNGGSDSGLFPHPFTGDANRPYSQFYASLKATKLFDLVSDPAQADLILEIKLAAPNGPSNPNKAEGASDPLPMFLLTIYDAKSHYVLWTLTRDIDPANLQKTHDRNFDLALAGILTDFETVTGKLPPASQ